LNKVREYAIETLASAPDAELRLYLLQLVQAIKYETTDASDRFSPNAASPTQDKHSTRPVSSLTTFLIDRAAKNIELANYLYWYVTLTCFCYV
jgi:phosphatidylinositol 3-kinase